jgi:nitrogen fixation NifU-like protein
MRNSELYNQEILEHYRRPQNYGHLKKADLSAYQVNPLCGDELELQLQLKSGRVKAVRFSGAGCAISMASASLLTENLKGKTLAGLKKLTDKQVIKNLGVPIGPARRKCALLPYEALREILSRKKP